MHRAIYAKLAGWAAAICMLAPGQLETPLKVRFHLADGVEVRGDLTIWDSAGIDGSFGRRRWTELKADDAWRLYQRVMDPRSAGQWVDLGRVLLQMVDADRDAAELAERAFKRALRLDEVIGPTVEQARQDAAQANRARQEEAAQKLSTASPEARPWPADPWPILTQPEQQAAIAEMRADAERIILEHLEATLEPLETDHFLLYSDVPRPEAARWIMQLEKVYELLRRVLPPADHSSNRAAMDAQDFWGKAVVVVLKDQAQFRAMESESFKHLVPQSTVGVCHPVGPKVFINLHRHDDDAALEWSMAHETVHGLMHRYQTPVRLPAWANEGIAEYVAGLVLRDSPMAKARRKEALEFIRNGGDVNAILDRRYADQTWLPQDANAAAVGSLLIELLTRDQPTRFVQWVDQVKSGDDWEQALRDRLTSRAKLADAFVQFYKVND
ncbi:MAG: hypothetical protein L0Y42_10515 [Phycisphaerales bacterium]|nr:hypothetical protein [Phycisphaerales bacterium]